MDFMTLLKSVEELLYELISWIVFYPLTLWKCLRRPLRMMAYAESELADDPRGRYADALSPPIFLFLTLILAHLFDQRFGAPMQALTGALADPRNLLLFRAVVFSLLPLMLATQRLRRLGQPLDRETLRPAFYSQCYVAAPFVLSFDLAVTVARMGSAAAVAAGSALFLAGLAWYVAVLTRWLATHLTMGRLAAFVRVLATVVVGAVALLAVLVATAFLMPGHP